MWSREVLVADEAIWVREGTGLRRIPWAEVVDLRVERAGFWRSEERVVVEYRDGRLTLPLTPELARRVGAARLGLRRAGAGLRR